MQRKNDATVMLHGGNLGVDRSALGRVVVCCNIQCAGGIVQEGMQTTKRFKERTGSIEGRHAVHLERQADPSVQLQARQRVFPNLCAGDV